jgi:diguanylate cyclase (GGDEF)-like protein
MDGNDNISLVERGANLRFLIIEDEPVFAQFLEAMVNKCSPKNAGIVIVDNAPDAIEQLQTNVFDVCFLDFFLKNDTTGMDVLIAMRGKNILTAFVFITVNDSKEAAFQALTLGAMDYLVKARFTEFDLAKSISFSLYRKYREVELQSEALKDSLTGLGNKALYEEQLRLSVQRAERDGEQLGVLMLDLDRFKPVNDTYGHEAGDMVLKEVASRIVEETRASDVVARVGGDEFAAVLVKVNSPDDVHNIRDKLARSIADKPYDVGGYSVEIGASVGAAVFPDDGRDIAELKRVADKRMYESKQATHRANLPPRVALAQTREREAKRFSF